MSDWRIPKLPEMTRTVARDQAGVVMPVTYLMPAKRCSDYDAECAIVTDHARCWSGVDANGVRMLDQADGYCPYLVGEMKR